jgi:flagellar biosynthesis regulator FlaF
MNIRILSLTAIGLWVVKEADAIRSQNAGDLTQMMDHR